MITKDDHIAALRAELGWVQAQEPSDDRHETILKKREADIKAAIATAEKRAK